jgi:hypothetical protein
MSTHSQPFSTQANSRRIKVNPTIRKRKRSVQLEQGPLLVSRFVHAEGVDGDEFGVEAPGRAGGGESLTKDRDDVVGEEGEEGGDDVEDWCHFKD